MFIIPEIQIKAGKVVTRASQKGTPVVHDISPLTLAKDFAAAGAELLQVVDVDAALAEETNNAGLIREIIASCGTKVQVGGGIRTLAQISEWFDNGAARVVLGTAAITDSSLVAEASGRFPGCIVIHLATKDGFVMINGWETQTSFRPEELIYDLQMMGIAGVIHKDIERFEDDSSQALALTETISRDISIPVYSSGTVDTLGDIARLRYIPNINGAIVGHALISGTLEFAEALQVATQTETNPDPETVTPVADRGIHQGMRAYLAAYNSSQASRAWNSSLRDIITESNSFLEVLIPQLDLDIDSQSMTSREVHSRYEAELDNADIVIVVLDGIENEAWTGYECGYARAKGKYIYGISGIQDDSSQYEHDRFARMCDELIHYSVTDEVVTSQNQISHDLTSRIMAHTS